MLIIVCIIIGVQNYLHGIPILGIQYDGNTELLFLTQASFVKGNFVVVAYTLSEAGYDSTA